VSQYILVQKKKSDDAETLGAIKRDTNVLAKYIDGSYRPAKIIECDIIDGL
tara:strand:+ start:87 stop:239 length:153 start_codon:yes stop_codon:yes gene_type:complete